MSENLPHTMITRLFAKVLFIVICAAFFVYQGTTHAAQLIDTIPAVMKSNWKVCHHYDSKLAECEQTNLPQAKKRLEHSIRFSTFEKQFILSSDLRKTTFGFWIPHLDDVDEVYVNGQLIGKTGIFLPAFESGFRYPRHYLVPSELLNFNQFNLIKIKAFSSRSLPSIQSKPPVLGNYIDRQKSIQTNDYIYFSAASLLVLLIIFQLFYFIVVKDNIETLYFSLFLASYVVIAIARSMFPMNAGLDMSAAFKIEVLMNNFGIIAFTIFVFRLFEIELRRIYAAGLWIIGLSGIVTIVWPYAVDLRLIAEVNSWLVILLGFLVTGSALIIALHKQRKYSWLITIVCALSWGVLVYDALMLSPGLFELELEMISAVLPVTATILAVIFSLTLTHKYWRFFKGSTYDHLTGTLLRPAFFQRLSEEMQRSQRGTNQLLVVVIDIQQARRISKNYGYSLGNHLLITVSNALTKVLRPFDLICRFSDEQFCVAASITSRPDAESCVKRIYEELISIEQPIESGVELYLDARVGGVIYNPDQHLSVSHLLQDANYALSKAKSQTKNNFLLIKNPTVTA